MLTAISVPTDNPTFKTIKTLFILAESCVNALLMEIKLM